LKKKNMQHLKQILLTSAFAVLTPAMQTTAEENPPGKSRQVDTIMAPVNHMDTPGCAVGVISKGVFVHKAGYGMANLELGVPLSPDSIFRIASVSKQITAAAVLLMADDGLIDLDEDIRTYLPALVDYGTKVSIRAMLGHVSGIADYEVALVTGDDIEAGARDYQLRSAAGGPYRMGNEDYLSISEFYDVIKKIPLSHPPMTKFDYSNTNYFLFSMLVEAVTGQSLRDYAKARIFEPLAMDSTLFHDDMVEIIKNRATGYKTREGGGFVNDMTNLYTVGDGGIHTSINDFIKWDQNFYQPKLGKDPAAFLQTMNTPNSMIKNNGWLYANGQGVGTHDGRTVFSHSGGWLGFSTYYVRYPEQQLSVVIFCNDAGQEPKQYARKISALYLNN
jgi:CubicO group peptidase (beta-lactamase class C family)